MLIKNPHYKSSSMVLLSLVLAGLNGCAVPDQTQANTATARPKVLSESMNTDDINQIRELIKTGADVDVRNKYGVTSLLIASQNGYTDIVKLLLDAKAEVNAAHTDGCTSLWMASQNGHIEVVKLLLEAGADVNAIVHKGGKDYTPLSIARQMGHDGIVKLLKEYGAKD